jgi:hypothetical protein
MSKPIQSNGKSDLAAEYQRLEDSCAELTRDRDLLRTELANLQRERDAYLETVRQYLPKDGAAPTFTKEEALGWVGQAPPLEDFIDELEREMRS